MRNRGVFFGGGRGVGVEKTKRGKSLHLAWIYGISMMYMEYLPILADVCWCMEYLHYICFEFVHGKCRCIMNIPYIASCGMDILTREVETRVTHFYYVIRIIVGHHPTSKRELCCGDSAYWYEKLNSFGDIPSAIVSTSILLPCQWLFRKPPKKMKRIFPWLKFVAKKPPMPNTMITIPYTSDRTLKTIGSFFESFPSSRICLFV